MTETSMNASFNRQPKDSDPLEKQIRQKIETAVLKTDFAKNFIKQSTRLLQSFFNEAISNPEDTATIKKNYKQIIKELAELSMAKITSGQR